MKLCDLHCHILPGVDDGARDMAEALEMLNNAVAGGVQTLVVTPHCNTQYGNGNFLDGDLKQRFADLQQAARDIPVELLLGAEVYVTDRLPCLLAEGKVATLAGSRYLLTELYRQMTQEEICRSLQQIISCGYTPLVAHPERHIVVQEDPGVICRWLEMGCHIQLTGGSILGEYGKAAQQAAAWLLRRDMVACVASDAHGAHRRTNYLLDVADHLSVHYSRQYARSILQDNPLAICRNEVL